MCLTCGCGDEDNVRVLTLDDDGSTPCARTIMIMTMTTVMTTATMITIMVRSPTSSTRGCTPAPRRC